MPRWAGLAVVTLLMILVNAPAHATGAMFYLGGITGPPNPVPTVNGTAVGPYPGTLNTAPTIFQFMCLDGNISTNWGTTIYGTEIIPSTQQEEESAFLASLLLRDAHQQGVTLNSFNSPNPGPSYTQAFMNSYSGPITFAIWQIMGTLPSGVTEPAGTQAFVNTAQSVYTNIFNNTGSPLHAAGETFLSSVQIFVPTPQGSNQRYVTMTPSDTFVNSVMMPEPGTWMLLASGLLLAGLNRKRLSRRS